MIYTLIGEVEATKVLNTSLFEAIHEDTLVWRIQKNGRFLACNAYHYCIKDSIDTSHLRISEKWELIWKIKAHPRVKNFLWQLCKNCVPIRLRLIDKGVQCSSLCGICGESVEDVKHLFLYCPKSIE